MYSEIAIYSKCAVHHEVDPLCNFVGFAPSNELGQLGSAPAFAQGDIPCVLYFPRPLGREWWRPVFPAPTAGFCFSVNVQ